MSIACSSDTGGVAANSKWQVSAATVQSGGRFADSFSILDRISLEENDSALVASAAGIHFPASGGLAIADASEADVKIFDDHGRLSLRIGRKGKGPGEFVVPVAVRIDSLKRVHVLDAARDMMSIFDSSGIFIRSFRIESVNDSDFFLRGTNEYLLIGGDPRVGDSVVSVADSIGRIKYRALPLGKVTPEGLPMSAEWFSLRNAYGALAGDTLFVALAISDSIWALDLETGAVAATKLHIPSYRKPHPAQAGVMGDPTGMNEWITSFHTIVKLSADKGRIGMIMVTGSGRGASLTLVMRDSTGQWHQYEQAPAVRFAQSNRIYSLMTDTATILTSYRVGR